MKCALLAIGCNKHLDDNLLDLSGAENDAVNIYNCLVNSEYAIYRSDSSEILDSPTLGEVKSSLEKLLLDNQSPDVFTMFFAGHGGVFNGAYYLCMNDSKPDRLSFSAFSLSDVFRMISSSMVKHVNIIIDACNTGGLVHDLSALIKPELIGAKNSFGVAILAASASDENANEVAGQGLLTGNLVKFLDGSRRLIDSSEFLDLVSIGRKISSDFIESQSSQTPSSWGFNLYGPSVFAKNPFNKAGSAIDSYEFSFIPPASRLGKLINESKKEFWDALEKIEDTEGANKLLALLQKLSTNTEDIGDVLSLVLGVGYRFLEQVEPDASLKKLEIINILLTTLFPFQGDQRVALEVENLLSLFKECGPKCFKALDSELKDDEFCLLYKGGRGFDVLANYYYVSIRVSKIFGLAAELVLVEKNVSEEIASVVNKVTNVYGNHLTCMCDSQASSLFTFFKAAKLYDFGGLSDLILRKYIEEFTKWRGQVSQLYNDPDVSFRFLLQRYTQEKIDPDLLAIPNELGACLLIAAKDHGLEDLFDQSMHLLDRKYFLLFIPRNIDEFSSRVISNGQNLVLRCGYDFWDTDLFNELCHKHIAEYTDDSFEGTTERELFCCIASALTQPNRLPIMLH